MLSGLLSLLLDLVLTSGQFAEGALIMPEDVVINDQASPTIFYNRTVFTGDTNVNVTYEDQESFQDQETLHHYNNCNETLLMYLGKMICLEDFNSSMIDLGQENWCDWEMVLSHYNDLTLCMERSAGMIHCYYPNTVVQEIFVQVHKQYFSLCDPMDDPLPDAPARVILVLTLLPVSVIPILVYMVIWKSSVID